MTVQISRFLLFNINSTCTHMAQTTFYTLFDYNVKCSLLNDKLSRFLFAEVHKIFVWRLFEYYSPSINVQAIVTNKRNAAVGYSIKFIQYFQLILLINHPFSIIFRMLGVPFLTFGINHSYLSINSLTGFFQDKLVLEKAMFSTVSDAKTSLCGLVPFSLVTCSTNMN